MKRPQRFVLIFSFAACLGSVDALAAMPVDETVMARFEALHDSMAEHQMDLEETMKTLTSERERISARLAPIEDELLVIERKRPRVDSLPDAERAEAMRAFEERTVVAKTQYLEVLTAQHSVDLELYRVVVRSGGAILGNLEEYVEALEEANERASAGSMGGAEPIRALQVGTARALAALESWGNLTRSDPRLQALWSTARMLSKAQEALDSTAGTGATARAVSSQIISVRALVDQAAIALKVLEAEGSLIQIAAQSLVMRLLETRMGGLGTTDLPMVDFEERFSRITSAFAEPFEDRMNHEMRDADETLANFDSCAEFSVCD